MQPVNLPELREQSLACLKPFEHWYELQLCFICSCHTLIPFPIFRGTGKAKLNAAWFALAQRVLKQSKG